MGILTRTQFLDELWLMLDSRVEVRPTSSGGTSVTEGRLTRYLNFGYLRLQLPSTHEHPELQSTETFTLVAGTQSYALSTTWAIDHIMYPDRNRNLQPLSRRQLSDKTTQSGQPTGYARWGNSVYMDRTPTSSEAGHVLTVWGWLQPAIMPIGGSILRSEWDEVILEGAAWRGWLRLGDPSRADFHAENYAKLVNDNKEVARFEARDDGWRAERAGPDYMRSY